MRAEVPLSVGTTQDTLMVAQRAQQAQATGVCTVVKHQGLAFWLSFSLCCATSRKGHQTEREAQRSFLQKLA